jgi:anti-anti-sigma regulatory factor
MKTFGVLSNASPSTGKVTITIEGDITLANSEAIKKELLAALENEQTVHFIATGITAIDLSGLQLLVALKKTLQEAHREVTFDMSYPNDLLSVVEHSGFMHEI